MNIMQRKTGNKISFDAADGDRPVGSILDKRFDLANDKITEAGGLNEKKRQGKHNNDRTQDAIDPFENAPPERFFFLLALRLLVVMFRSLGQRCNFLIDNTKNRNERLPGITVLA
jgi:hypothetical protein